MGKDKLETSLDHLVMLIGLCQVPREQWSPEDEKHFIEARKFVQYRMEERRESNAAQVDSAPSGSQAGQPHGAGDPGAPQDEVPGEGLPVQTRTEGADEPPVIL